VSYEVARDTCSRFSPRRLAQDYGANSRNPDDISDAYASSPVLEPDLYDANYAGCLDGLTKG
jgi:hypothetical protein